MAGGFPRRLNPDDDVTKGAVSPVTAEEKEILASRIYKTADTIALAVAVVEDIPKSPAYRTAMDDFTAAARDEARADMIAHLLDGAATDMSQCVPALYRPAACELLRGFLRRNPISHAEVIDRLACHEWNRGCPEWRDSLSPEEIAAHEAVLGVIREYYKPLMDNMLTSIAAENPSRIMRQSGEVFRPRLTDRVSAEIMARLPTVNERPAPSRPWSRMPTLAARAQLKLPAR